MSYRLGLERPEIINPEVGTLSCPLKKNIYKKTPHASVKKTFAINGSFF